MGEILIEEVSKDALFNVRSAWINYCVAFLPGTVAVYGFDIGKQYFKNPENKKPWELKDLFKDRNAMIAAATLHRVGIINKKKFLESLDYLVSSNQLSSVRRNILYGMVNSCECTPLAIRKRMEREGYSDVLAMSGFELEDHTKELEETVRALGIFIKEYKREKKNDNNSKPDAK